MSIEDFSLFFGRELKIGSETKNEPLKKIIHAELN
jgi:hypothetical protein